jgi:putative oxidoreductase
MRLRSLVGRILFGGFFFAAGWNHFMHHAAMARMVGRGGIPMPELAVIGSGLLIFLGGASILFGLWPRVGCLLIAFLVVVTPLAHNFWAESRMLFQPDGRVVPMPAH